MSYIAAPVWFGYSGTPLPHPQVKPCVLMDLDGSLLNNMHRQHYMQGDKKNWAAFFDAMRHDTVYPEIKLIADLIFKHTDIGIILVTGRPSQYHGMTLQTLHDLEINFTSLIMRAQKDNRSDVEVKLDMLKGIQHMGYKPMLCIDDRPEVVAMWRQHGVPTLQCDPTSWESVKTTGINVRALIDENERLRQRVQELDVPIKAFLAGLPSDATAAEMIAAIAWEERAALRSVQEQVPNDSIFTSKAP